MSFIGKHSARIKLTVQLIFIMTAIAFICLGIHREEVETVFSKAIHLCLECVGIG